MEAVDPQEIILTSQNICATIVDGGGARVPARSVGTHHTTTGGTLHLFAHKMREVGGCAICPNSL
jgi:hypothetical protein